MKNIAGLCCFLALTIGARSQDVSMETASEVRSLLTKVANWQIDEYEAGRIIKLPLTEWENGAFYTGMVALKNVDDNPRYDRFLYGIGEQCGWDTGPIRLFADDYCIAQLYSAMYMEHGEKKMIAKWKALADTIVAKPFDESLAISRELTHRGEWAWCDALYMGAPSLALLTEALGDMRYLNKADSMWWKTSDFLYSEADSLYFRDNRFFDRRETNGKNVFWSRGNGWVLAALARMLEIMPADFPSRPRYEQQFREMAAKIIKIQQADGSWHASLYDPETFAEKESSGTGFFCFALFWGINSGVLSSETYLPAAERAWTMLQTCIHPDGKLGYVQNIGDKPVGAAYESTNVYGVGAFLLAGSEYLKFLD